MPDCWMQRLCIAQVSRILGSVTVLWMPGQILVLLLVKGRRLESGEMVSPAFFFEMRPPMWNEIV